MAVEVEVLARNAASALSPPEVKEAEIDILTENQVALVMERLAGYPLYETPLPRPSR
jgi:hypothetical protein